MDKLLVTILLLFLSINLRAQQNATELFHWEDANLVGSWAYNNTYNECWGFEVNESEIAVIGSTAGTHFFDVTDPANSTEVAFVEGAYIGGGVIHRDYHDFQGYLYAVCDEGSTSTLQIIDISNLPNSVNTVYDSNQLFTKSHNIFIDTATAKLYACASNNAMDIYSLHDPINPVLLYSYTSVDHVHDAYVRNDTAYLNCGGSGFKIVDFSVLDLTTPVQPIELASLTSYPDDGYNHSGWLSDDGNIYAMQDENHGYDVKILDVSNFNNISVLATFNSGVDSQSMAHNGIIKDDLLYLAYYHDGLRVFDISDPSNPVQTCSYETYLCDDHNSYKGAWGVYPYLPSGNIIVSDMQSGLFILNCNINATWNCVLGTCDDPGNGTGTYTSLSNCQLNCGIPSWNCNNGICEDPGNGTGMYASQNCCEAECVATDVNENLKILNNIFPNPTQNHFTIQTENATLFKLFNILGEKVKEVNITDKQTIIQRDGLKNGLYFYILKNNHNKIGNGKVIFE